MSIEATLLFDFYSTLGNKKGMNTVGMACRLVGGGIIGK